MDSRQKIVTAEAARAMLATGSWVAVSGLFDPLTAVQARRLAGLRRPDRKLMAIIEAGASPLLPAEARAALTAALRAVDVVTVANSTLPVIPPSSSVELVEDPSGECTRSTDFIAFVLERHRAAGGA
jgi:hypothetical protein